MPRSHALVKSLVPFDKYLRHYIVIWTAYAQDRSFAYRVTLVDQLEDGIVATLASVGVMLVAKERQT